MNETILTLTKDKTIADLKQGKRADGRGLEEYREITITSEVSKNADGAARVKLGETEVIAGIKFVPGEPYPDSPDKGTISVSLELLSFASPEFETGPPKPAAIELGRVVDRGIRESKAIDFKSLCIREGELVWIVFIDIYVLNDDGNMFDAASLAAVKALQNAKIPKLDGDKIVPKEHTNKGLDLKRIPVLNTFAKVSGVIVADPSLRELVASDARFSVAVTDDGYLSAFQKGGKGFFLKDEISKCIDIAIKNSEKLRKKK